MYNLIEHYLKQLKLSERAESLWFCSNDDATNFNSDITNNNNFKCFRYKPKLLGNTDGNNGILKNATIALPLKYLSNFLRLLEISLLNFKIELKLKWKKYCVLQLVLIMTLLIVATLFFPSKTQKYISPL